MYEFKVGDVIHVTSKDEYDRLMLMLDEQGYRWNCGDPATRPAFCVGEYFNIYIYIYPDKKIKWSNTRFPKQDNNFIEFIDIIEPDEPKLTAMEAIRMHGAMCTDLDCNECPLEQTSRSLGMSCVYYCSLYPDKALKIIKEYYYTKILHKDEDYELIAQKCEEFGCPSAAAELRSKWRSVTNKKVH